MGWRLHMKFIINSALFLLVFFLLLQRESLAGQKPQTETQKAATQGMKLDTGQEIFEAACVKNRRRSRTFPTATEARANKYLIGERRFMEEAGSVGSPKSCRPGPKR